ncbi:carcinoembryonic antigen-related cell adhesion molecule 5-like [Thalassophryne amazonica]|uniref:carcinoembryonic antigen-related cell adhesion molecule 5-like n=1 Tax=Thalassophryne amazonica TaxID=390379 RepID=UPI001470F574|nr:carcinoembryonic antigen-related cell adhesion molecule 5-like [Thalassophryne amazonica]
MVAGGVILFIILGVFSALSHGTDVIPDDHITARLGGKVTFITKPTPSEQAFLAVSWRFHFNDSSSVDIITSVTNVADNTGPEYEGRISLNRTTGSLELRNLSLGDSGEYKVQLVPVFGASQTGVCRLTVYEPISSVVVTSSSTELLEFSSSVNLSCSASGSSLSFCWLNGTSEVTGRDRVKLSDGNSTLTIVNVTRYDQRTFRCQVSNIGSNGTSEPIILLFNFGPENINLMISPSREYYYEGTDVTLSCSAASSPPAQYRWFLNESILVETGPELRLLNIELSQSGNYSCQAVNNKTLRNQTSEPSAVTVVHAHVSNVMIHTNSTELVEFNSSVSLSCSSSGSSP